MKRLLKIMLMLTCCSISWAIKPKNIIKNNNFTPNNYTGRNFYQHVEFWSVHILHPEVLAKGEFFISTWHEENEMIQENTNLLYLSRVGNANYFQSIFLEKGNYEIRALMKLKETYTINTINFYLCNKLYEISLEPTKTLPIMHIIGQLRNEYSRECQFLIMERNNPIKKEKGVFFISNIEIVKLRKFAKMNPKYLLY